jgi:mannose-1-phosphate guanylyltransferase
VQALILAGGSGTRFWPLSRRVRPKQLLRLEGDRSLLQGTVERLKPLVGEASVWVCTTSALADAVREQLPEVPAEQVLAEPTGRNTAPAIGWAAQRMVEKVGDEVIAVLPADHRVGRPEAFRATLEAAAREVLAADRIMTLGVVPRWAETGYGYLELGEVLDADTGLRRVARFTEKPDAETARRFFEGGSYLWNAGIFVFRGPTLLARLAELEPEVGRGLREIAERPGEIESLYPTLPSISIDYAVMERLDDLGTLPLDCEWSDLGSWAALAEILPTDEAGNAPRGDTLAIDATGNLLYADRGAVAVLGVHDLAVVRTGDTVLVIPKDRAQEVRRLVDALRSEGRDDLL